VLTGIGFIGVCRRMGEADPGAYLKGGKAAGRTEGPTVRR